MELIKYFVEAMQWVNATGASDTVLHIHGGLAVMLFVRIVTGRSLATPLPWLCVWAAALGKEGLDYLAHGEFKPDTLADIANSVLWPTILFIGLRVRRVREVRKR